MSGSKSPQLSPSAETQKNDATQSSEVESGSNEAAEKDIGTVAAVLETDSENLSSDSLTIENIELSIKQTQWVFASTCYAFGVLKRDFDSPIDNELLDIIRNKLNDEPGFHHDTLDFGNNHFHDKLELVVRQTWGIFLNPDKCLDKLELHTHKRRHDVGEEEINGCNDSHNQQKHQAIRKSDDNNSAIDRYKTTPNSSSGGDSTSNDLNMIGGNNDAQAGKVYLGGLSDDIEETDLRDYFKEYGTIADINIVLHKDTGKRRGFAFVEYENHEPVDKIVCKYRVKAVERKLEVSSDLKFSIHTSRPLNSEPYL